jgi:hypothetical protein
VRCLLSAVCCLLSAVCCLSSAAAAAAVVASAAAAAAAVVASAAAAAVVASAVASAAAVAAAIVVDGAVVLVVSEVLLVLWGQYNTLAAGRVGGCCDLSNTDCFIIHMARVQASSMPSARCLIYWVSSLILLCLLCFLL